ncbi:outer membrane beta-barrel family protein [Mucilaginibacter daejeonensis]|uniref:outer membrane beta-barrel family protein n=1 Tax=Mucilaginibacter daejeonensis TaxID=398049 RepID=UPI001D176AF7|nr:outer membrane beta-barrel family protein [Mucilaginibacter daejeonensis]UEG53606.1 outer membrane beta-barrel family protein [Mucilaginibacter daejeonensis]
MRYLFTTLFLCLFSTFLFAQNNYAVKGSVVDTASNAKLTNATVMVLNAKDSTLRKFARAGANGVFNIGPLNTGKFILLVTYPKYADYVEDFTLDSAHTTYNAGQLNLMLRSMLLASVMVKGTRAAIKIKGDTTEFNASSFTVQPNAKVEDLLKQLPGITVDKDGKITAQGQTVNKVLVDGEEFFGDDPTLVTKNLRADMVDKVQLYDKSSDQAAFTGIDDGNKSKTINIKLKEDKKNGYFGKVEAGIGTKKFYQEQAAFNKFRGKEKISAYGTLANTGKTGLGWEDANKYGTGGNNVEFVDGGINISGNGNDDIEGWSGRYSGDGLPVARAGGAHYDNKWNGDKVTVNGNYKIGSLTVTGDRNVLSQNNIAGTAAIPASSIITNSDQNFKNYVFRQKADGAFNFKLDSLSNLKIAFDGTLKSSDTESSYRATSNRKNTETLEEKLLNNNSRDLSTDGDQKTFNFSALYTKKFKKVGRTISATVSQTIDRNDNTGFLLSNTEVYNTAGGLASSQKVDQFKVNDINTNIFNSNIAYSEPFSKSTSILLNYGIGVSNSTADRRSFNKSGTGRYDALVDSLSNNYRLDQFTQQGGAIFNYKKDKTTFNFGTKLAVVDFQQLNKVNDREFDRHFVNWNPQLSYQYRFSQQKSFRFNYNGNTRQPTIDQIQPIIINIDPTNLILGNPDLRPSFTNRFQVTYNTYKVLSNRSLWINGSYSFTSNPIVSNITTNAANGYTVSQSVNLSGQTPTNYSVYASTDSKVKFLWSMNIGIYTSVNGSTSFNMVRTVNNNTVSEALNRTVSNNLGGGLSIQRFVEKKFDIWASFGPTYNTGRSSLNPDLNNNGFGFTTNHYINFYLPAKLVLGTDGYYEYRAPTRSFNEDFKRFIANVYLTKSFLKDESLKLKVTVNDVFNQNQGFSRNAYGAYITQTTNTTIKRYALFSLIYDFSKMGGGAAKK